MTEVNIHVESSRSLSLFTSDFSDENVNRQSEKLLKYFTSKPDVLEKSCLAGFEFDSLSFDILLCDNETIREINAQYRCKDCPTDVISFALFADAEPKQVLEGEIYLGEIIISLDKTEEQRMENNETFEYELYFLVSHGILHLLGFDHLTNEEYEDMMRLQGESLREINV